VIRIALFRNEAHALAAERDRAAEPVHDATPGESANEVELDSVALSVQRRPVDGQLCAEVDRDLRADSPVTLWPLGYHGVAEDVVRQNSKGPTARLPARTEHPVPGAHGPPGGIAVVCHRAHPKQRSGYPSEPTTLV